MTEKQRSEIIRMRRCGTTFSKISDVTGISVNTIKSFCRRHNITVQPPSEPERISDKQYCKECGAKLHPLPRRKAPKFCSSACRTKWWNTHPEAVCRKAVYHFECANCGKKFTAYGNKGRKYCCHSCYVAARFKL